MHGLAAELEALDVPSLVLYRRGGRGSRFEGPQTAPAIVEFVRKLVASKPLIPLRSVADVDAFLSRDVSRLGLGVGPIPEYATTVVGLFSDAQDLEEDEFNEYRDAAKELQPREAIYTAVVKDPKVCAQLKRRKVGGIDRTPALLAQRGADMLYPVSVNLDELYGDGQSVSKWIFQATLPLVGEMSGSSFKSYEELGLPMLILFLDLSDRKQAHTQEPQGMGKEGAGKEGALVRVERHLMVPGESGGLPNVRLLEEFQAVAADHVGTHHHATLLYEPPPLMVQRPLCCLASLSFHRANGS